MIEFRLYANEVSDLAGELSRSDIVGRVCIRLVIARTIGPCRAATSTSAIAKITTVFVTAVAGLAACHVLCSGFVWTHIGFRVGDRSRARRRAF